MTLPIAPSTPTTHHFAPSAATTWRTGLLSIAVALTANLVLLGLALLAGAEMQVRRDPTGVAVTIGVGLVAVSTVLPMLLATLALLPLRRWGPLAWRALALAGLVVGLATVPAPFTMMAQRETQTALALMHILAGLSWFLVVRRSAQVQEVG